LTIYTLINNNNCKNRTNYADNELILRNKRCREDYIWEDELQIARGFRTKIDLPLRIAFNLTPRITKTRIITLDLDEFIALRCDLIGIRLAVKETR